MTVALFDLMLYAAAIFILFGRCRGRSGWH